MKKEELVIKTIPISELEISGVNVRKEHDDREKIRELAKSIEKQGILQPLLVRPENSHYGIIVGSRRFSAAKKARLKNVPAIIRNLGDQDSLVISLIENLHRNDLEPRETTQAMRILNKTISERDLADKLGKSKTYVHSMVTVGQLLTKLEEAGTKVKMNPTREEKVQKKAIPFYHAVKVAEAFKTAELKPVLEKEPDKDVEVAKAVTNIEQKEVDLVIKQFKKYPDDDVNYMVEQAQMGLLHEEGGHAKNFRGLRGSEGIDILRYEGKINEHTANLCFNLSDIWEMPRPTEDVEVDYIRKSREFRKMFLSELHPMHRAEIHNRLNYLSALIEETMDEIEEIDKKK